MKRTHTKFYRIVKIVGETHELDKGASSWKCGSTPAPSQGSRESNSELREKNLVYKVSPMLSHMAYRREQTHRGFKERLATIARNRDDASEPVLEVPRDLRALRSSHGQPATWKWMQRQD